MQLWPPKGRSDPPCSTITRVGLRRRTLLDDPPFRYITYPRDTKMPQNRLGFVKKDIGLNAKVMRTSTTQTQRKCLTDLSERPLKSTSQLKDTTA